MFLKKRTLIINTVVSEIERQENVLANTRKLCIVWIWIKVMINKDKMNKDNSMQPG